MIGGRAVSVNPAGPGVETRECLFSGSGYPGCWNVGASPTYIGVSIMQWYVLRRRLYARVMNADTWGGVTSSGWYPETWYADLNTNSCMPAYFSQWDIRPEWWTETPGWCAQTAQKGWQFAPGLLHSPYGVRIAQHGGHETWHMSWSVSSKY